MAGAQILLDIELELVFAGIWDEEWAFAWRKVVMNEVVTTLDARSISNFHGTKSSAILTAHGNVAVHEPR